MNVKAIEKYISFTYKYFALLIFPILILLALNKTSNTKIYDYHAPIYADGAGYYSYLINIYCKNEINTLPIDIEAKTGNGFKIDGSKNIIVTKYTIGSAMLMSPFFLVGKNLNSIFQLKQPIFSKYYWFWIIFAACFYCSLGLLLINRLAFFATNNKALAIAISLLMLFATNLLYYVINKPSYSHIYSFFLCASFVYLTFKIYQKPNFNNIVLICFVFGLLVVCRPTNFLLIFFPLFFKGNFSLKHIITKNVTTILIGFLFFLIAVFPQLYYWKTISGSAFFYSYNNEGFRNWQHPKILYFLFSTVNGWFTYTPLMLTCIVGIIVMIKNRIPNATNILFILISAIYIFSSWWIPNYGCSFGMRVMVEYYPLLSIPIAYFFNNIFIRNSNPFKVIVTIFIFVCIYLNIDMIYYYDGCFYGGDWDWQSYLNLLEN